MTTKQIKAASKADVDLVNSIAPPVRGAHAGSGIHVDIPSDWSARIANGEDVAGCNYAKPQADGSLLIDDRVQVELQKPGKEATLAKLVDIVVVAQQLPIVEEQVRTK